MLESEEIVEHLSEMEEENSRGWLANLFQTMSHADLYSGVGNYVGNLVCKKKDEGLENEGPRIEKVLEMKTYTSSKGDKPCYRSDGRSQSPKLKMSRRSRHLELEASGIAH